MYNLVYIKKLATIPCLGHI